MTAACLTAAPYPGRATTEPAPVQVVICASHHEVLSHWLRAAREGTLPATGVRVVHVDSHPDLAVPEQPVPADRSHDPDALVRGVDIATFQLPAVWIGLVRHVVWVRPAFARQFPDGELRFRLGTNASGQLRVDDEHDYYVLDEGWAPGVSLGDPVPVRLSVVPLGDAASISSLGEAATILDIDMDTFATRNPAAERLRRAGLSDGDLDQLRTIFAPENLALAVQPAARIRQVEHLLEALETLAGGPWRRLPGSLLTLWRAGVGPGELLALYRILGRASGEAPLEALLEDGRELVGLPEHTDVSPAEIAATALALRDLLRKAQLRPALVTLARSVDDGYTPRDLWPEIESATLLALGAALGELEIRYDRDLAPAPRVAQDSPALRPFLETPPTL